MKLDVLAEAHFFTSMRQLYCLSVNALCVCVNIDMGMVERKGQKRKLNVAPLKLMLEIYEISVLIKEGF